VPEPRPPQPLPRIARPTSITVWGFDRPLVNRVTVALAKAVGPEFFWFEIRDGSKAVDEAELAELRAVDPKHAFRLEPREVAPDARLGSMADWSVIVPTPEEQAEGRHLASLLAIPPKIRELVLGRDPDAPPAAFVISNTDRAANLYPGARGSLTPLIEALNQLRLTFVATSGRVPRENAQDCELVFQVVPGGRTGVARVVCERGDVRFGPTFRGGTETPLPAFLRDLGPA